MKIIAKNSRETQKVAAFLAKEILAGRFPSIQRRQAAVLALSGDLGAGKTTFIQGFAKGLGVREKILSPTFVILKKFKIPNPKSQINFRYLYHIDCYRIDSPKEIIDLGFRDAISDPQNIVVIEWAERIKKILPKSAIWMEFKWLDKNKRKIIMTTDN